MKGIWITPIDLKLYNDVQIIGQNESTVISSRIIRGEDKELTSKEFLQP